MHLSPVTQTEYSQQATIYLHTYVHTHIRMYTLYIHVCMEHDATSACSQRIA